MRIPLHRIIEKLGVLAAQASDIRQLELVELIHDLAEHVKDITEAERGEGEGSPP